MEDLLAALHPKIEVKLILVRRREAEDELIGGELEDYLREAAVCILSSKDWDKLGRTDRVKINTSSGSVVVRVISSEGVPEGIALVPRGPLGVKLINLLESHSAKASIEATKEEITELS